MTVPTVLVSIPGSAALRTLIYFDQADTSRALENGVATVLAVIAMVAGLSVSIVTIVRRGGTGGRDRT